MELLAIIKTGFDMLTKGIELISKTRPEKFFIRVEQYNIDTEDSEIIVQAQITNINKEPFHVAHIAINFNDEILMENINPLDVPNKYSEQFRCMEYQPYLLQNQMAYGWLLFKIDKLPKNIKQINIKLEVEIAGLKDRFVCNII